MSYKKEQWEVIEEHPKYIVSDLGTVFSIKRGRSLKGLVNQDGYDYVGLYTEGRQHRIAVHRVVAKEFVSGWFQGAVVNHIDEDKTNNTVENLEWVTIGDNNRHSKCKYWDLVTPTGDKITVNNLRGFCLGKGLSYSTLHRISNIPGAIYQGWSVERASS